MCSRNIILKVFMSGQNKPKSDQSAHVKGRINNMSSNVNTVFYEIGCSVLMIDHSSAMHVNIATSQEPKSVTV